jgi:hypothetical protein
MYCDVTTLSWSPRGRIAASKRRTSARNHTWLCDWFCKSRPASAICIDQEKTWILKQYIRYPRLNDLHRCDLHAQSSQKLCFSSVRPLWGGKKFARRVAFKPFNKIFTWRSGSLHRNIEGTAFKSNVTCMSDYRRGLD